MPPHAEPLELAAVKEFGEVLVLDSVVSGCDIVAAYLERHVDRVAFGPRH